jgi:hypothetical protein
MTDYTGRKWVHGTRAIRARVSRIKGHCEDDL